MWRWGVPVALIGLLCWQIDAGPALRALFGADPVCIALGLLLVQLQIVLSAERWRITAARLGLPLTRAVAVAEYHVSSWLNQVLPGGVSGDVVRVVRHRSAGAPGWQAPARAVVLERLAGQVAFVAVALAGLVGWPWLNTGSTPVAGVAVAGAAVALLGAGAGFALLLPHCAWTPLARFVGAFGPAIKRAYFADGMWWVQGALSLAVVACYLAVFALASAAVGAPLEGAAVLTLVPLTLLTMLLPFSVAGWGVREAAAAALWPLAGYSSADGLAASLLYGLMILAGTLPGALLLARRPSHAALPPQASSRA